MPEYQQRVITERDELVVKLNKLNSFLSDPEKALSVVGSAEFGRLSVQKNLMTQYEAILTERITYFN